MEKKQTAVEWLGLELNMIFHDITPELWEQVNEIFKQAKQMEKEQVLNFEGLLYQHEVDAFANHTIILTAEEFYDKLYGGEDEK
jgi:hypothetical protein